jgi:catechol 2,3-dioxygenase-like lactoylglutathione lyase family enzyme
MDVQFVASFSPIVADPSAAEAFYQQALGLSFEGKADDYVFTEMLGGVKHFVTALAATIRLPAIAPQMCAALAQV